ncbi:MAG: methyltransferase domain-containing protein, partial [Verrucomicrobiota bacterium]
MNWRLTVIEKEEAPSVRDVVVGLEAENVAYLTRSSWVQLETATTEELNAAIPEDARWVLYLEPWEELVCAPEVFRAFLDQVAEQVRDTETPVILILEGKSKHLAEVHNLRRCVYWPHGWDWRYVVCPVAVPRAALAETRQIKVPADVAAIRFARTWYDPDVKAHLLAQLATAPEEQTPAEAAHYQDVEKLCTCSPRVSLVTITRDIGPDLVRMLRSVEQHVDEIVLVATHEVDWGDLPRLRPHVVKADYRPVQYIALSDGSKSIDDFAAARNFAHSLATGEWHLFLDSDDVFAFSGDYDPPLLKTYTQYGFPRWTNQINVRYDYEADEAGVWSQQTRVCMWRWRSEDGHAWWRWHKPVHERVEATPRNEGVGLLDLTIDKTISVYYIKHFAGDPGVRTERNVKITLQAIESGTLTEDEDSELRHALGASVAGEDPGLAEELFNEVMRRNPASVHALCAAVDLSDLMRAQGRCSEARQVARQLLDYWVDEPQLNLAIARAYAAESQSAEAAPYFVRVYFNTTPGFEYRINPLDFHGLGRVEAALVFDDCGQLDNAARVLRDVPEAMRDAVWDHVEHAVSAQMGDWHAVQSLRVLVSYLLSLDHVDKAAGVIAAASIHLQKLEPFKTARYMVQRRLDAVNNPLELGATYNCLNVVDRQVGGRRHLHHILADVVKQKPDVFYDLGCNTGWLALHVKAALPDCEVYGFDISAQRIAEARERSRFTGTYVEFNVAPIGSISRCHEDPSAEVAVCASEVLEHFTESYLLVEQFDILRADRVYVTVPDAEWYHLLVPTARRVDVVADDLARTVSEGREHVRCFTAHELVHILGGYDGDIARLSAAMKPDRDDNSLVYYNAAFEGLDSTRRPRIDIIVDGYVEFGPRSLETGHVGGSEQAVCHLAPRLVKRGFDVHVWVKPLKQLEYYKGVWWHHYDTFDPMAARDALVVWRRAELLNGARLAAKGRYPVFFWAHDVPQECDRGRFELADQVWALSPFHVQLFQDLGVPARKIALLQNGVDQS